MASVTLCGISSVSVPTNFADEPCCGRSFLERIGVLEASTGPHPRISPTQLKVHSVPLHPPLPTPEVQQFLHGDPLSDRGQTLDWPHPGADPPSS